jgi:hypothetical protein
MKIIFITVFLLFLAAHASANSFKLTCTTSIRHVCLTESGCKSIKDNQPSTYTIYFKNAKDISISHFIGGNKMTSWNAKNIGEKGGKYIFSESGVGALLSITDDLKIFSYIETSGITQYNLSKGQNMKVSEEIGGQIRTGNCLVNP